MTPKLVTSRLGGKSVFCGETAWSVNLRCLETFKMNRDYTQYLNGKIERRWLLF